MKGRLLKSFGKEKLGDIYIATDTLAKETLG
jgi:hypothetical protein